MTRRTSFGLAFAVALGLLCGGVPMWRALHPPPVESAHAVPLESIPTLVPAPTPSAWLTAHFAAPLPAQGPAPAAWAPVEASLKASDCSGCHVEQVAAWRTSRHAAAMGLGLTGQAIEDRAAQCDRCHAPLAEQAGTTPLTAEGVTCAACHVRGWARSGPPRREGVAAVENAPHGGFTEVADYADPAFCSTCHDFSANATPVGGKRLQETTEEWRRTPAAAAGKTCQTCHLPDRAHTFAGVHDAALVKAAFTAEAKFITDGGLIVGRLRVKATDAVGHRLPTYTTAELWLTVDQLDRDGLLLDGTHREAVIGRRLSPDNREELFDTRLFPGETHDLAYSADLDPECSALLAKVEVRPEAAYERHYADWIDAEKGDGVALGKALEAAKAARFVAWQERVVLPE